MSNANLDGIRTSTSTDPIDMLKKSLVLYDHKLAEKSVNEIIKKGSDPNYVLDEITRVMSYIGCAFAEDELFLPDLVSAADTMESIMPALEKEILKSGKERKTLGKIVIGTVKGDIHTIGKTMVGTLLKAGGFDVFDIGIDVSAEKFIKAIYEQSADILAMSALLTTTAYEQKNVLDILKKENLRKKVKVMIGGGAVTQEFADSIGADGYDSTAPGAVMLAKKLLGK